MNGKMRMFIICAVFALISSCKNDVNGKALETSEQSLEIPKQIEQEIKKEFNGLLNILETKDLSKLDEKGTKEIEKKIKELKETIEKTDVKKTPLKTYSEYEEKVKELKETIEKTDVKKTPLKTYSEYEEKVKEIREKLKDKFKDKKELEKELKDLEESLKKKKEERKKALEEAKKKFEELKTQVGSATGVSSGDQSRNQGQIGQQALKCANELGFKNMTSSNSDTSNMTKEIIENSLKKIEEELKNTGEEAKEAKKE